MATLDVLNCGKVAFAVVCPQGWDSMRETDDPRQRFCQECERKVFRCHDANEAGLRAEQGECIAVPDWLAEGVRDDARGHLVVGRPDYVAMFARIVRRRQGPSQ